MSRPQPTWTWYELMTTDLAAATRFYGEAVGLGNEPWPDPAMEYTLWKAPDGQPMGGLAALSAEAQAMGAGPSWMGVIGVADTDAIVARAVELGGTLLEGPMEVPGVGRFAVLADPTGAAFSVMADPNAPAGEPDRMAAGRVSWHELWSSDPDAAWAFYSTLFGWEDRGQMEMGEAGLYRMYGMPGAESSLGGIARRMPHQPLSTWCFYVNVDSVEDAVDRVKNAGGAVLMGPHEVPGGGQMLFCADPQGAGFALYSPAKG